MWTVPRIFSRLIISRLRVQIVEDMLLFQNEYQKMKNLVDLHKFCNKKIIAKITEYLDIVSPKNSTTHSYQWETTIDKQWIEKIKSFMITSWMFYRILFWNNNRDTPCILIKGKWMKYNEKPIPKYGRETLLPKSNKTTKYYRNYLQCKMMDEWNKQPDIVTHSNFR